MLELLSGRSMLWRVLPLGDWDLAIAQPAMRSSVW